MKDYTKYRFKKHDQLAALLENKDKIFVVVCKKCFKKFTWEEEPEYEIFEQIASSQGKTIVGHIALEFLCNKTQTESAFKNIITSKGEVLQSIPAPWDGLVSLDSPVSSDDPVSSGGLVSSDGPVSSRIENIFVIACGAGVQTVAETTLIPTWSACDSTRFYGRHSMALTNIRCRACAQCFLNLTGGICPIVYCSKSLVNGQCGGAKNGKCEIDKNRDCGWINIHRKLEKQGRLQEFLKSPVQIRDYA